MPDYKNILSNRYTLAQSWTLAVAERAGAYGPARKALVQEMRLWRQEALKQRGLDSAVA